MTGDERAAVAFALDQVEPVPSAVTIGNFDGVHRGHGTLLRRVVDTAHERSLRSVAITFDPHPAAVLRPGSEPVPLQTLERRVARLRGAGVDLVLVLPFTEELAALAPESFVRQVLVDRLAARHVVVGTNFRFGHRAAGTVVTLVEEGERHGFDVAAVGLVEIDGVAVSSTAVREHLAAGDVAWVTRALGRPYELIGEVVAGEGRGRTIGVPTANLALPQPVVVPAAGVYAGHATPAGAGPVPAVTNVGVRPTFGEGAAVTVETHLLDAAPDLYGVSVTVSFEHRLRDERRFDGVEALVAQIRADVEQARALLEGGSG